MVLCCVLLQLFSPEIFRLLRRRPELFGHWMRAYLVQDQARNPAFVWQKTAGEPLWEEWVKKMEGKGHKEARDVLKSALEFAKQ